MKIRKISFFEEFKCSGGDCPETCCRGWIIPLTPEDVFRLQKEKGRLGFKLFMASAGWSRPEFNSLSRRCPFHNKEGLCSMQLQKGHDFLPLVCRGFPRFYRNYGPFEEWYLDLSCIEVVKLFIKHANDMDTVCEDRENESDLCTTNDDTALLEQLCSIRNDMCLALSGVYGYDDLRSCMYDILECAKEIQQAFLSGNTDFPAGISQNRFRNHDKHDAESMSENTSDPVKNNVTDLNHPSKENTGIFPLPLPCLWELINSSFYHIHLSYSNPELYTICGQFFQMRNDGHLSQARWDDMVNYYLKAYPEYAPLYAAYFSYYLRQYFLRTFETYSFVRIVSLGIMHTNMVLLLNVLHAHRGKGHFPKIRKDRKTINSAIPPGINTESFAHIIAVYNRRAFFNDNIIDDMYKILSPYIT